MEGKTSRRRFDRAREAVESTLTLNGRSTSSERGARARARLIEHTRSDDVAVTDPASEPLVLRGRSRPGR